MSDFFFFAFIGFIAQMIDGTLGMAYGVSCNTLLLGLGISPLTASASVHTAEVFTTAVSGFSHFKLGNVDLSLFKKLVVPGVVGGVIGAYILSSLPGEKLKPFISLYLLIMGLLILYRSAKGKEEKEIKSKLIPLGFMGGFFDAIGGGGWGPIVTTTLVARGNNVRKTIGSVNLAEFFLTVMISIVFLVTVKLTNWKIITGLISGGVLAAPLAARICKKIPHRKLMVGVGILISLVSAKTLLKI